MTQPTEHKAAHYEFYDDQGNRAVLCVDRNTGTCTVLRADTTQLETLVAHAHALLTAGVQIAVSPDDGRTLQELEDAGWKRTNLVVLEKSRWSQSTPRALPQVPSGYEAVSTFLGISDGKDESDTGGGSS